VFLLIVGAGSLSFDALIARKTPAVRDP
jgi:hypothetical protein